MWISRTGKEEFLEKLKKETKKYAKMTMNVTVDSKYHLPDTLMGESF